MFDLRNRGFRNLYESMQENIEMFNIPLTHENAEEIAKKYIDFEKSILEFWNADKQALVFETVGYVKDEKKAYIDILAEAVPVALNMILENVND